MSVVTTFCTIVTSLVSIVFGDTTPRVQNYRISTKMSIANHLGLICTPLLQLNCLHQEAIRNTIEGHISDYRSPLKANTNISCLSFLVHH